MAYSPLQMAEAFIRAGELMDALEALDRHLSAQAGDDNARRLRAAVLQRLPGEGRQRAALDDLDHLTQPTAEDWVQRSIISQALDDWEAANAAMEQARRLKPDDERMTERYLLTLEKSHREAAAGALLDSLPRTWRWLQLAGDLAGRSGDKKAALACYNAALEHLDQVQDTVHNPFAANLKTVLTLKRDAAAFEAG